MFIFLLFDVILGAILLFTIYFDLKEFKKKKIIFTMGILN